MINGIKYFFNLWLLRRLHSQYVREDPTTLECVRYILNVIELLGNEKFLRKLFKNTKGTIDVFETNIEDYLRALNQLSFAITTKTAIKRQKEFSEERINVSDFLVSKDGFYITDDFRLAGSLIETIQEFIHNYSSVMNAELGVDNYNKRNAQKYIKNIYKLINKLTVALIQ